MEGQSVVLKAEKGKLKLSVDDKEMTYDIEKGTNGGGTEKVKRKRTPSAASSAHGLGEGPGGAGDMDGAGEDGGR